jgi:hypothetical protein
LTCSLLRDPQDALTLQHSCFSDWAVDSGAHSPRQVSGLPLISQTASAGAHCSFNYATQQAGHVLAQTLNSSMLFVLRPLFAVCQFN